MSVDWTVVCDKCERYFHLGQDMGGICSFGYGSNDSDGQQKVADLISEHILHHMLVESEAFLRIVLTDNIPSTYKEIKW